MQSRCGNGITDSRVWRKTDSGKEEGRGEGNDGVMDLRGGRAQGEGENFCQL